MAEKKWVVFGVLVLLVLIGFLAANKFYFYPYYSLHLQPLPAYTPPTEAVNAVVIKPFEGTLKTIMQQGDQAAENSPKGQRNPFLWQGELNPVVNTAVAEKKEQPVEIPRLGMILVREGEKTAMLDGTLVHTGDTYAGHRIEAIEPEYVILSGGYGVLKISVQKKSFGVPQVDILEETNPNLLIKPVVSEKKQR